MYFKHDNERSIQCLKIPFSIFGIFKILIGVSVTFPYLKKRAGTLSSSSAPMETEARKEQPQMVSLPSERKQPCSHAHTFMI